MNNSEIKAFLTISIAVCALVAALLTPILMYNTSEAEKSRALKRECLATAERISNNVKADRFYSASVPSCDRM